jgi:hypothetical protein
MMAGPSRARAAALLQELELDAPVLQEPAALPARGFPHLSHPAPDAPPADLYPRHLAAWALDRGLPIEPRSIDTLLRRWRAALCLSNSERDALAAILRTLALLESGWDRLAAARQKRTIASAGPSFFHAFDLLRVHNPPVAEPIRARVDQLRATPSGICPEPLLTGDHLVEMGLAAGPRFKRILDEVYDAQLEDRVATFQDARELARTLGV